MSQQELLARKMQELDDLERSWKNEQLGYSIGKGLFVPPTYGRALFAIIIGVAQFFYLNDSRSGPANVISLLIAVVGVLLGIWIFVSVPKYKKAEKFYLEIKKALEDKIRELKSS